MLGFCMHLPNIFRVVHNDNTGDSWLFPAGNEMLFRSVYNAYTVTYEKVFCFYYFLGAKSPSQDPGNLKVSRTIVVRDFDANRTTEDDLLHLFDTIGTVESVDFVDIDEAEVVMSSPEDAKIGVERFNHLKLDGCIVRCDLLTTLP